MAGIEVGQLPTVKRGRRFPRSNSPDWQVQLVRGATEGCGELNLLRVGRCACACPDRQFGDLPRG